MFDLNVAAGCEMRVLQRAVEPGACRCCALASAGECQTEGVMGLHLVGGSMVWDQGLVNAVHGHQKVDQVQG